MWVVGRSYEHENEVSGSVRRGTCRKFLKKESPGFGQLTENAVYSDCNAYADVRIPCSWSRVDQYGAKHGTSAAPAISVRLKTAMTLRCIQRCFPMRVDVMPLGSTPMALAPSAVGSQ